MLEIVTKNLVDNNNNNLYVIPLCLLLSLYLLLILDQCLNNMESKTVLELIEDGVHEFYHVVSEQGGSRSRDLQGFSKKRRKIRDWYNFHNLSAGLFSNSDISFVNCWIGLKFLLEVLNISRKSSIGGIFDLSSQ